MRYYVIAEDGQKYGPADTTTLNQWIKENRLLPTQQLEEEASGMRMAASAVPDLAFSGAQQPTAYAPGPSAPSAPGPQAPGGFTGQPNYYARGQLGVDDSSKHITTGWILGILGLVFACCGYFAIIGVILASLGLQAANRAEVKGNPSANAVKIFNVVVLILDVLGIIAGIVLRAYFQSILRR